MNQTYVINWKSQIKKGVLSFILLNILKNNEYYGYELIEKIKKYTDIDIAEGTLYPIMNRLKNENLVESRWVEQKTGIPRKYYCLTDLGLATLIEMTTDWSKLSSSITKVIS